MTLGALAKLSLCDRCDVRHSLTPWWKASCLLSAHKPQPLLSATHMLPHGPGSIPSARPLCPPSSWTDPSCPSVSYTGHLNTWLCSPWGPWRCCFLYENAAQLIPSVTSELTDEVPSSLEGCSACLDQVTGHPTPPTPPELAFIAKSLMSVLEQEITQQLKSGCPAVVWKLHTNSKSRALVPPVQLRNTRHRHQRHTAGGDQGLSEAPLPPARVLHWQTCFLYLEPRALSLSQAAN